MTPLIHGPEHREIPQNPVRDPAALGPDEDLDRQPDGVPHLVIGLTALFAVALALVVALVFATSTAIGKALAVSFAVLAVPVIVVGLRAKANRLRDRRHPSR